MGAGISHSTERKDYKGMALYVVTMVAKVGSGVGGGS